MTRTTDNEIEKFRLVFSNRLTVTQPFRSTIPFLANAQRVHQTTIPRDSKQLNFLSILIILPGHYNQCKDYGNALYLLVFVVVFSIQKTLRTRAPRHLNPRTRLCLPVVFLMVQISLPWTSENVNQLHVLRGIPASILLAQTRPSAVGLALLKRL